MSLASWFSFAGSFCWLGGFVVDRPRMESNPAPFTDGERSSDTLGDDEADRVDRWNALRTRVLSIGTIHVSIPVRDWPRGVDLLEDAEESGAGRDGAGGNALGLGLPLGRAEGRSRG